jgi:hypothetical protein
MAGARAEDSPTGWSRRRREGSASEPSINPPGAL